MLDLDRELLREFLFNEDGKYPKLADLPRWWEMTPPDAITTHSDLLPIYAERDVLLASYSNWAFTKPWAWEGLRHLLETLTKRREPIPELLQTWANAVAIGSRKPPAQGRGRPAEDERDYRMLHAFRILRDEGLTRKEAIDEIADAIHLNPESVKSQIRKIGRARPDLSPGE